MKAGEGFLKVLQPHWCFLLRSEMSTRLPPPDPWTFCSCECIKEILWCRLKGHIGPRRLLITADVINPSLAIERNTETWNVSVYLQHQRKKKIKHVINYSNLNPYSTKIQKHPSATWYLTHQLRQRAMADIIIYDKCCLQLPLHTTCCSWMLFSSKTTSVLETEPKTRPLLIHHNVSLTTTVFIIMLLLSNVYDKHAFILVSVLQTL